MYVGGKKKGLSIVGAKQKQTKRFVCMPLLKPSVDRKDIVTFLQQTVKPGSLLFSDGASIYKGIGKWWPVIHDYEVHAKGQFAKTAEIEGVWGNFRTFVRRMYHHVTYKNYRIFLGNFAFVFPTLICSILL